MKRLGLPISLVLLAVALALGIGCPDPTEGKPAAAVADPLPPVETAPPVGEVYTIAEGSTVSFVGSKVTGSHDGGFHDFEGTITLPDGDPMQGEIDIVIDTTSLWSDNEKLTNHLKSPDFFDVASHPTATFRSSSIAGTDSGYEVTGNLDLHGVSKSITFPATIELGADSIAAQAEFSIKRFDFGIAYTGAADDLIRDDVLIKLDIVAQPGGGSIDPPTADDASETETPAYE